jgi:exopolysaccharide biosynthesis WecB/TagA/CpsF family protein
MMQLPTGTWLDDARHITAPTPATTELFGLPVVNDTAQAVLADLMGPNRRRVHFLNAHCVNVMARVRDYRRALATADAVLPDGAGIELALRLRGERLAENLNGTDFVPRLAQAAASAGQSVFLLGARPGTAEAAAAELQRRAPGLRIAGTLDGFAGAADSEAAIARINDSGADILLVALGVPKQDIWLAQNAHRLAPRLSLGVGACFDFLAGNVSRAPLAMRRARLEWVWRLAQEPRRLAGRYLVGNASFTARAVKDALRHFDRGLGKQAPAGYRRRRQCGGGARTALARCRAGREGDEPRPGLLPSDPDRKAMDGPSRF